MIHYGKTPSGELEIRITPEDVGELNSVLLSAGLMQRRTFQGLSSYIAAEFEKELTEYYCRHSEQ